MQFKPINGLIWLAFFFNVVTICHSKLSESEYSSKDGSLQHLISESQHMPSHIAQNKFSNVNLTIDPDAERNLTELITSKGYPAEVFTVQTADGFLLDLHRIPHGKHTHSYKKTHKKSVVYLQHALLSTACDWVMNLHNESLGFILADAGYDVWMGNTRGNTYSRRHVSLSPQQDKFWDWSFDEMATYDMPAFINFILNKTEQPTLSVVGHSQGTMMNFALFSERPDMKAKVNLFVALAPVAFVRYLKSPIKYLGDVPDSFLYEVFGRKEFLTNSKIIHILANMICQDVTTRWMCEDFLFLIVGTDAKNFNQSRMDVYFHHSPSGVSVKDMVHFAQLSRVDRFAKYNFGSAKLNMAHYNQTEPPSYNVTKIKVPIVAFSGGQDWLADPTDVDHLMPMLPSLKAWYKEPGWNHMDFVWGLAAAPDCYAKILVWLEKYNNTTNR